MNPISISFFNIQINEPPYLKIFSKYCFDKSLFLYGKACVANDHANLVSSIIDQPRSPHILTVGSTDSRLISLI